ncbi:MAG: hypothetical protein ACYDEQ_01705 [Desulfocucumaceae bacterium]
MSTKEIKLNYCSFEELAIFDGEKFIDGVLSVMEREDRAAEKIVSYGLCGITGLYLFASVLRVLL